MDGVQVRGEQPKIPSGFHLLSRMFGSVTYVPRSEYSDRAVMFQKYTNVIRAELAANAKVGQSQSVPLLHAPFETPRMAPHD